MFERFIRLAEARGALRKGRFEQALKLARDPSVATQRRAKEVVEAALKGLLARAQRRRDRGDLSAALTDVSRILTVQPEFDGAQRLRATMQSELADATAAERTAREMLAEARSLVEGGDLGAAEQLCSSAHEIRSLPVEEEHLAQLIRGRREAAAQLITEARSALRAADAEGARELLRKARAQCRDAEGGAELGAEVASAWAEKLLPALRQQQAAGDEAAAYALLARERTLLPELDGVTALQSFARDTAAFRVGQLRGLLDRSELDEAVEVYGDLSPRLAGEPAMDELRPSMELLARGLDLRDRGDFAGAVENLNAAEQALPGSTRGVAACAKQLGREQKQAESALQEARELAAAGRLVEARQRLTPVLEQWPMHEAVRREIEILDNGARDKEQRLGQARALASEGRLGEASAQALSLAVPGPQGEEARLLLVDVQARMDLVQRGLDQVRRAVHGRHSGSAEGLRHCLKRLDQLGKIQCDSADLTGLRTALEAEIAGIELLDAAAEAVANRQPEQVTEHLGGLADALAHLLRPDRLDARCLELADQIGAQADDAVAAGRLTAARSWLHALAVLGTRHGDVKTRADALGREVDRRQQQAEEAARRGEAALGSRDLEVAEGCLREARDAWVDGAPVQRLEAAVRVVHGQQVALQEVEQLTAKKDYEAAHRKLGHLPPTPAVLRTRIFDIKQGLARAQGLDGGFILRVDEGGEFLVLRGDSVSIGNVRDGHADLAVLANIAGRHATIVRSMSFHGGMQDRVVAERGEVSVGGAVVTEHKLASGDRVKLGSALEFAYRVPSSRSLTAALTLSSGFQVGGTDKVLLMRDRGRDGRILIGASADAHVRVPHDQPEVEIFARKDGQIRVCYDGKGTLDGRPFRGEHPVAAGTLVICGKVTLVLQPWSKTG